MDKRVCGGVKVSHTFLLVYFIKSNYTVSSESHTKLEFVCLSQMERIEFCKRGVGYEHFNSLLFWRR